MSTISNAIEIVLILIISNGIFDMTGIASLMGSIGGLLTGITYTLINYIKLGPYEKSKTFLLDNLMKIIYEENNENTIGKMRKENENYNLNESNIDIFYDNL